MKSVVISVTENNAAPTTASSLRTVGLRRDQIVFEEAPEKVRVSVAWMLVAGMAASGWPSAATAARSPAMRGVFLDDEL